VLAHSLPGALCIPGLHRGKDGSVITLGVFAPRSVAAEEGGGDLEEGREGPDQLAEDKVTGGDEQGLVELEVKLADPLNIPVDERRTHGRE